MQELYIQVSIYLRYRYINNQKNIADGQLNRGCIGYLKPDYDFCEKIHTKDAGAECTTCFRSYCNEEARPGPAEVHEEDAHANIITYSVVLILLCLSLIYLRI